jgi:hypothetical protein
VLMLWDVIGIVGLHARETTLGVSLLDLLSEMHLCVDT